MSKLSKLTEVTRDEFTEYIKELQKNYTLVANDIQTVSRSVIQYTDMEDNLLAQAIYVKGLEPRYEILPLERKEELDDLHGELPDMRE